MRKFIWICDRCGAEIWPRPRVLDKGEMYITRKKEADVDLCGDCLKSLAVWFATINSCDGNDIAAASIISQKLKEEQNECIQQ